MTQHLTLHRPSARFANIPYAGGHNAYLRVDKSQAIVSRMRGGDIRPEDASALYQMGVYVCRQIVAWCMCARVLVRIPHCVPQRLSVCLLYVQCGAS